MNIIDNMDYKGKRVLVLDGYGRQVPAILKELHQLGCHITTLNDRKLDVGYTSRFPDKKIVESGIRKDADKLQKVIEREMASGNYDVFLPMVEKSTDILTKMVEEGRNGDVKVIAAPRKAFLKAYDKEATMRICQENGIPCPRTKMDDETMDEYLSKVKFPLACKPRKGSGAAGFKKVESREDLLKYIEDGVIEVDKYVIQEYIPQTDYRYGSRVMLDKDHNIIYDVTVQSCRSYPIDGGPGCYIRTTDRPDINAYAEKLLQVMNWVGFAHVSFIMDPRDWTPKVIEINGRIPASIKICSIVGAQPVKTMLDLVYDQPMTPMTKKIPVNIALRYFHTDFLWLLKSPTRFSCKPSWFNFRHNHDYIWDWSDPLPFFSYSIEHMQTYKADMAERKH